MGQFDNLITDEHKQMHVDAITEVLRACSVTCTLEYGTRSIDCPNCIYDSRTGKSTNRYQTSPAGPIPFTFGVCPYCNGEGKLLQEETQSVDLCPIYDYQSWYPMTIRIESPLGFVQTMSPFSLRKQLIRAKSIIIDTAIDTSTRPRFERWGEPEPCGFGGSDFIVMMWRRVENG